MKILLAILFLVINTNSIIGKSLIVANLKILDKSSSSKYDIKVTNSGFFRSLNFKLISCDSHQFEKYLDTIALIEIKNQNELFTGWFFSKTEELNTYSNKIYEISLISCNN
ncbi:DUF2155 domain-containing protein [Alphaproteobacteria bacterium]|nr:DUF2155 domain-containing protein [Alphaproteobacteria bacterium]